MALALSWVDCRRWSMCWTALRWLASSMLAASCGGAENTADACCCHAVTFASPSASFCACAWFSFFMPSRSAIRDRMRLAVWSSPFWSSPIRFCTLWVCASTCSFSPRIFARNRPARPPPPFWGFSPFAASRRSLIIWPFSWTFVRWAEWWRGTIKSGALVAGRALRLRRMRRTITAINTENNLRLRRIRTIITA